MTADAQWQENVVQRRSFLKLGAGMAAASALPASAFADVTKPYDWAASPPTDNVDSYVKWMVANRGEEAKFLRKRWERYTIMRGNQYFGDKKDMRGFLMTPREEFTLKRNQDRAYEYHFLDIDFGVTISGPDTVGKMTSALDIKKGEKVLEIGTGSGYQSAYLANMTDKVWSIEIIKPLAERTRTIYDALIKRGYEEYKAITSKNADGYYGWEEAGPFDKIVVTCGIDHIPPPLLKQLSPGGVMVIPVGPPGAHHVLKVVKEVAADGSISVRRSDIYKGKIVPFVPFTKLVGDSIKGNYSQ
jgi:protein-L-isoaspartate(D-aspartate) O-methyltransferase